MYQLGEESGNAINRKEGIKLLEYARGDVEDKTTQLMIAMDVVEKMIQFCEQTAELGVFHVYKRLTKSYLGDLKNQF